MNGSRPVGLLVSVLLLAVAAGSSAFAATIKVPADYSTIQAAINAAANGDVVVVAEGTYKENINFMGKAITVRSTGPLQPAVVKATVINGNKKGSVVTFQSHETAKSVLSGFTLTNGSGTVIDQWGNAFGGGVYCTNSSSPTLINNLISGNTPTSSGGGVYCYNGSSPIMRNNTISGNSGGDWGGGVYCNSSSPTLTNNTISGNTARDWGGGVYCYNGSSPIMSNNTISDNSAFGAGGVYCGISSPTLTHNIISHNSASDSGGVCCVDSSPTLTNNIISGNSATGGEGGGVDCDSLSSPTLTYNIISDNSANTSGGGVYCYQSSPTLRNNTVSGNSATNGGGVFCDASSSPVLKNNILALNTKGGGLYVADTSPPSKPVVTYCDFYGNAGGNYVKFPVQTGKNGNISVAPRFADPAAGNFYLMSQYGRWAPAMKRWVLDKVTSPCIDAGDPTSAFNLEPAPNGGRINMGAYGDTPYASKSASAGSAVSALTVTAAAVSTSGGSAQIVVTLASAASVEASIVNIAGREIAVLPAQDLAAGVSSLYWDGRSALGTKVPAGQYLVRVTARTPDGGQAQTVVGLALRR